MQANYPSSFPSLQAHIIFSFPWQATVLLGFYLLGVAHEMAHFPRGRLVQRAMEDHTYKFTVSHLSSISNGADPPPNHHHT